MANYMYCFLRKERDDISLNPKTVQILDYLVDLFQLEY